MPRFRPKWKEIIAVDAPGTGWIIETPDGKTVPDYSSFTGLWEEIPPWSMTPSPVIKEAMDLLEPHYGVVDVANWWKDAKRALKFLQDRGL